VESWKRQIRERIDNMGRRPHIALQLAFIANGNTYEDIDRIFNSGKEAKAAAEEMWNEGKYIELLEAFEIKKFPNPMYRVRFDSDEDMKVLVNVFGMKALENWDGDMLGKYAAIEIEKQYMI
jgi:hypothetical protein